RRPRLDPQHLRPPPTRSGSERPHATAPGHLLFNTLTSLGAARAPVRPPGAAAISGSSGAARRSTSRPADFSAEGGEAPTHARWALSAGGAPEEVRGPRARSASASTTCLRCDKRRPSYTYATMRTTCLGG